MPILQLHEVNKKRKLIVCRHGETDYTKRKVMHGWLDIPLNDTGKSQARELGDELRDVEMDCLYSSDLLRANTTALEIVKATDVPFTGLLHGLRTWDIGKLSGAPDKEGQKILIDHAKNHPEELVAGGESFNVFRNRILLTVVSLLNENPSEIVAIVTHSKCEELLSAWEAKGYRSDLTIDFDTLSIPPEKTGHYKIFEIDSLLVVN